MVNLMREIAETPPDPAVKDIALQAAETLIEAGVAQIECGRVILAHEGKIIERTPPDLN
ncbi:MAG: hypothetical protein IT446_14210 [Phycisphaerales bacterium]|nr:hypothetical protein [Phycisphaerales bacterium]